MTGGYQPWYRSRTIWAAAAAAIASLSGFVGELAGLGEQIDRLAAAGFALYAVYGRIRADKKIGPGSGDGCPN